MKTFLTITLSVFLSLSSVTFAQTNLGKEYTSKTEKIPYLVATPDNYQTEGTAVYPVLLFLHGGDRSNTKHHPLKYAKKAGIDFPFITIAPHCTSGCNWANVNFDKLLEEIAANYKIDKDRIYVTGYSMGGYGTWSAIANFPDLFAAAAPICGGGNEGSICKAKGLAIKAFHGDKDRVIPHSASVKLVNALKKCKANAELVTIEGGDHGIWPKLFQDPKFYDWFLTQKR